MKIAAVRFLIVVELYEKLSSNKKTLADHIKQKTSTKTRLISEKNLEASQTFEAKLSTKKLTISLYLFLRKSASYILNRAL